MTFNLFFLKDLHFTQLVQIVSGRILGINSQINEVFYFGKRLSENDFYQSFRFRHEKGGKPQIENEQSPF
jgi:hypothetical protein